MAEVEHNETQEGGKKKTKKQSARVDMTPMVDLMCLLITFFMLTTAFSKPKIMEIVLPERLKKDEKVDRPKAQESRTINIILGPENKIFYYNGKAVDPKTAPPLQETDFSATGIRQILLERNRALFRKIDQFNKDVTAGKINIPRDSVLSAISKLKRTDDTGPIVLIKAYKTANYGNFVDILDEMSIIGIAINMFVDITWVEEAMVEAKLGITPTSPSTRK
jgi:biopolymer transport protein ExbD